MHLARPNKIIKSRDIGTSGPGRRSLGLSASTLLCAVALAGCATPPPAAPELQATLPPAQPYVIGAGDHLGIFVYDQPQLSEADLPVRPDGRISTPLVADIEAAGKTPSQLGAVLTTRLAQYVRDPKVTVLVLNFVGAFDQQIRVVGAATEPLAIPYRTQMTVLDVLIETKGLTRFAAGNRAVIIRLSDTPGAPPRRIPVRLSDLVKDGDISQNIAMRPGDTLIIPESWF
jgi:polysaccharide export outer membrane protein